ncbi:MAG TPA: acyltransferase [Chitinophagaceae bacterium]|nr:acyltransferase [Chitinophagaceae bacterium]
MTFKNFFFNTEGATRSRMPWIDYTKGIAIILVIYRHVWFGLTRDKLDTFHYLYLKHANDIVYSFRMPLFFILSGIFVGKSLAKRTRKQFIVNKFDTLLYPYLIWAFIQVTLQILFTRFTNSHRGPMAYLDIIIQPRVLDQLWYLISLFDVTLLYMVFKSVFRVNTRWQLLLGLVFYYLATLVQNYSLFHDAFYYYFFYAVGDNISLFVLKPGQEKKFSSFYLLAVLLPLFAFTQLFFINHPLDFKSDQLQQYVTASSLGFYFLFVIITLIGCAFLTNISFILQRLRILKWFRVVGYHSLYIYVIHLSLIFLFRIVMTRIFGVTNVPVLLFGSILIGVVLSIMIYNFLLRMGGWFLFTWDPSKKKMTIFRPQGEVSPES